MKSARSSWLLAVALAALLPASSGSAEEEAKTLPTLLIKGEVVSLDTTDPSAQLLKVKDRYGFETPIFLTPESKVAKGDAAAAASDLTPGAAVEVEYNFDVNTAKRHAVTVKLSEPASEAAPAAAAPAAGMEPAAPATAMPAEAPATPAMPESSVPPAPATQPTAPATQ